MAVDWSIFWPNLLTVIISSILTLLIGWLIAWFLIHRYQRRNIEIQNKNKIIEEISVFKTFLQKTTVSWLRSKHDENNIELLFESGSNILDVSTKEEILKVKILNQYPDYISKKFTYKDENDISQRFSLKDVTMSVKEYINKMADSLEKKDFSEETKKDIWEKNKEISLYLSYVLIDIIQEQLYKTYKKTMKKNI